MRVMAIVAALLAVGARRAEACSPPMCGPSAFLPSGGEVPANAPAFLWLAGRSFTNPGEEPATAALTSGGAPVAVTTSEDVRNEVLVRPSAPLTPGAEYRFEVTGGCAPLTATFRAGPAAERPKSLGTLGIEPTRVADLTVSTASGSCSTQIVAAQAAIALKLSAGTEAWAGLLRYRTLVDEQAWTPVHGIGGFTFGGSWEGRGKDRIFAFCHDGPTADRMPDRGVSPGMHRVRMEATLPGTDVVLSSATWLVDLRCEGTPEVPKIADSPLGGTDDEPGTAQEGGCASAGAGALGLVALGVRRRRLRG